MRALGELMQSLIEQARWDRDRCVWRVIPAREPEFDNTSGLVSPKISELLSRHGIHRFYTHQAEALRHINAGRNVLLATPTASGKSLTYQIPVLELLEKNPLGTALFLFPFKALAQDQFKALTSLTDGMLFPSNRPVAGIYDGDTNQSRRLKLRRSPPGVLMTNPDMIHYSLLPYHSKWKSFLENLSLIVVDEMHSYRGVFGSHVLQIFRRFQRIVRHFGAKPQWIGCSATIGNPVDLARNLIGEDFQIISQSGAPAREKGFLSHLPEDRASTSAVKMFEACLKTGLKTIVFTKSRRQTELIYRILSDRNAYLMRKISVYRAGFLAEERREIEGRLFRNELDGVISTSALELGIDIGGLDCCILVGFPGSVTSLWQRSGRVGRQLRPSLVVFIAGEDALDRYWFDHEPRLHQAPVERVVVYQTNDAITDQHLECAADELPIVLNENYPNSQHIADRIEFLKNESTLLETADGGMFLCRASQPQRRFALRSLGENYKIVDENGRIVGDIDGIRVLKECHDGAIYLHGGQVYRVSKLDRDNFKAYVEPGPLEIYTQTFAEKETEILNIDGSIPFGNARIFWGRLKVTERISGYKIKRIYTSETISSHELSLPEIVFETRGLWIVFNEISVEKIKAIGKLPMGGLHAVEHAVIGLYPLISICDRNDLAGISTKMHPQAGGAAVFIYDGVPGGLGLAESALENFTELISLTKTNIESCDCETGCPHCIQSPKCGAGNEPLDKAAAVILLDDLLHAKLEIDDSKTMTTLFESEAEMNPSSKPENKSNGKRLPELPSEADCPLGTSLVFDIETQFSADEVGGWSNVHLMKVAVCVVYDIDLDRYEYYLEDDVPRLIRRLANAALVIGFNSIKFDYTVLSGYQQDPLPDFISLDILPEVVKQIKHRLSLNQLAFATLNAEKSADGLQSLVWWKEGKIELIAEYCMHDVEITYRLYQFGKENGYLLYVHRSGMKVKIPVNW